jgi:hypothetical protein
MFITHNILLLRKIMPTRSLTLSKQIISILSILLLAFSAQREGSAQDSSIPIRQSPLAEPAETPPRDEVDLSGLKEVSIRLSGPMCPVCFRRLEGRLLSLPGIVLAKVEPPRAPSELELKNPKRLKKRTALIYVAYNPHKVSISKIKDWIKANDFHIQSISKNK